MHEELESAHADPARRPVLVHLDRIEVVTQEATHVLEDAILWFKKVDPGEEIQDQVALDIICLLEHVQLGVRLADGSPSMSVGVIRKMKTHQGKPPMITSMSPGCGGRGNRELS